MIEPYQAIGLVPTMRGIRHRAPYQHEEYRREVIDKQIELMHERDIWRRPGKG